MSAFNPLAQQRAIRDDKGLTPTQRCVLLLATLRTDNGTGHVRCSQEILADDAGYSRETVSRVLRAPAVRRYFTMEREGRRLNLMWRTITCDVTEDHTNVWQTITPSTSTYSLSTRTEALAESPRGESRWLEGDALDVEWLDGCSIERQYIESSRSDELPPF